MNEYNPLKQINSSGFPFQLLVKDLVSDSYGNHKWRPILLEHYWANPESGKGGFIDLVLEKRIDYKIARYLVVECKRINRAGKLVFLNPHPSLTEKHDAYVFTAERRHTGEDLLFWEKRQPEPRTLLSSFCTVPGQSDKNTPMLERTSAELLDSLECLADEKLSIDPSELSVYIPVIVTNTELLVCQFNPMDVDLSKGELPDNAGNFHSVPYIRFQKSMPTRLTTKETPMNLEEANLESQRTIIVIHAPNFPQLLSQLSFF